MKVLPAFVSARVVDSLPYSMSGTRAQAEALKDTAVDGLIGYLGVIDRSRLGYVLDAGLGFMAVTRAGEYSDGAADEIAQLRVLGIPSGSTVWLDLEGLTAFHTDPAVLMRKLAEWARPINGEGHIASLYVGSPQPLTGPELFSLPFFRYWWGLGRCADRENRLAEPDCGWCMVQQYHGQKNGMIWKDTGVLVDTNGVQLDYRKRAPVWVVA